MCAVTASAAGQQPGPQRTGDHREDHVVDRAAVRLPHLLEVLQIGAARWRTGAARSCASFSSDRGAGLTVRRTTSKALPGGAEHLGHHRADVLRGEPGDVDHLRRPGGEVGDGVHDQVDVAGRRVRDPRLLGQVPRPPVDVQDRGRDVDRADPVDHRVMGLVDQRDPAAGQPLDDVDLPQRAGPVQRAGDQPADQLVQLDVGARLAAARTAGRDRSGRSPRRPPRPAGPAGRARTAPSAGTAAPAPAGTRSGRRSPSTDLRAVRVGLRG